MGKRYFDLKTKNAVTQIQAMIAAAKQAGCSSGRCT
jgi:hypothetical protein